jgi:hypothetical protein
MAFHYLDASPAHAPADMVTNNHFDQDGLVSVHALVDPESSLAHRDLLIDVAAAGDFSTYRDRRAARASMALAAYADEDRSPIADQLTGPYDAQCVLLYETTLPLLVPMVTDSERFRELWAEEDDNLTVSERLIATGEVAIEEVADLDLAVITVPAGESAHGGHRFAHETFATLHPMALHNATGCFRLLLLHGSQYQFVDRYETWVQYRSRRPLQRVDMRPLAEQLTVAESSAATWSAGAPGSLTPTMENEGESTLDADTVRRMVIDHLRTAAAAWDPYQQH